MEILQPSITVEAPNANIYFSFIYANQQQLDLFFFFNDLQFDMSKWLKAVRTRQILSCFGNSFSAVWKGGEEAHSIVTSSLRLPGCLCPLHPHWIFINFPLQGFSK